MPVYPVWLAGSKITAAMLTAMQPVTIVKPADQPVTNSTTLVNDNDLSLPALANATYIFKCYLDYDGGTQGSSDLKLQWQAASGATIRYQAIGIGGGGGMGFGNTYSAGSVPVFGTQGGGAGNPCGVTMIGTVVMSSTGGNLYLKWAQSTSNGTATTVRAQSFLELLRTS